MNNILSHIFTVHWGDQVPLLTVKHLSKASCPQFELQIKSISGDLPGIMTQSQSVRDVVHTHAR